MRTTSFVLSVALTLLLAVCAHSLNTHSTTVLQATRSSRRPLVARAVGRRVLHSRFEVNRDPFSVDPGSIPIDTAHVILRYLNALNWSIPLTVYAQTEDCVECDLEWTILWDEKRAPGVTTASMMVQTEHPHHLWVNDVEMTFHFGDRGEYSLSIDSSTDTVTVETIVQPRDLIAPIFYAALYMIGLAILIKAGWVLWEWYKSNERETYLPLLFRRSDESVSPTTTSKPRYVSLDAFRGFCLAVMIFVNYGGGMYWFFRHATWNSVTFADLVFPWFIFMMGVSCAIVLKSTRAKRTESVWLVMLRAVRRVCMLFAFGLFLSSNNSLGGCDFKTLRIPGVLQRFAVSYFVVFCISYLVPENFSDDSSVAPGPLEEVGPRVTDESDGSLTGDPKRASCERPTARVSTWARAIVFRHLKEITMFSWQWLLILMIHGTWYAATYAFRFEDCPAGYVGPGGNSHHADHPKCTGGMAGYLDRTLLGEAHIYHLATPNFVFQVSVPFDPEGILGSLNSIVLCFLGLTAGRTLVHRSSDLEKMITWICYGVALCLLGGGLCGFTREDGVIPLNKNLWSSSFVYVMGGTGYLMLAAFYFVVDIRRWWRGTPFVYLGMNSIVIYMLSELLLGYFPFATNGNSAMTHEWMLFSNLLGVVSCMIIAYWLHHRKLFFAV